MLAGPVEHEVDRGAAAHTRADRTRSITSRSSGQSSARWQYTLLVRGQVSRTLSAIASGPSGSRIRNGNDDVSSGFRAITNSTAITNPCHRARRGPARELREPGGPRCPWAARGALRPDHVVQARHADIGRSDHDHDGMPSQLVVAGWETRRFEADIEWSQPGDQREHRHLSQRVGVWVERHAGRFVLDAQRAHPVHATPQRAVRGCRPRLPDRCRCRPWRGRSDAAERPSRR